MGGKTWGAIAGAALLLLVGCAPEPGEDAVPPEPEVLTASKAGGIYLDAVCPVNDAWDELDVEVDRLRIAHARGETEMGRFHEAALALGEASEGAAKLLEPKNKAWPEDAVDEVEAVRASLRTDAKRAKSVAELPIAEAAVYVWPGAAEAGAEAAAAREALGLPADPIAACLQWDEQQAAQRAAEQEAMRAEAEADAKGKAQE